MVRNILNRNAINTIGSTNVRGTRLDAMRLRHLGVCCSVGTRHAHVAEASHTASHQSLTQHQPPVQEPRMQPSQPQEPGSQSQPGVILSPVDTGRYGQPQGERAAAVPFTTCSRWAPLWAALVLGKSASPAATSHVAASPASGKRLASS